MKCPYEILGCPFGSPIRLIKKSYLSLAKKLHPDTNPNEDTTAKFIELQKAYMYISDPEKKLYYDEHGAKLKENQYMDVDVELYDLDNAMRDITKSTDFFKAVQDILNIIEEEEAKWSETDHKTLSSFGNESTEKDEVLAFYREWGSYMTQLSFLWLNSNEDISQLQNRSERRYVISENKKRRDEAKKLRNRQFRELIQLIKSSDSRIEKFKNERKVEIERKIAEDQQKVMEERLNDLKIANEYRLKQDEELEEAFGNIQACEYKNLKKNENVEYTFCTACKKSIKASYMPVHITKQVHINNDRSAKKNNKKSKRNRVATDS